MPTLSKFPLKTDSRDDPGSSSCHRSQQSQQHSSRHSFFVSAKQSHNGLAAGLVQAAVAPQRAQIVPGQVRAVLRLERTVPEEGQSVPEHGPTVQQPEQAAPRLVEIVRRLEQAVPAPARTDRRLVRVVPEPVQIVRQPA